jgi:undecaprenyl-diphosphatase
MTALQAILLGLIQGLTEFLPVSSSGHLLLGSLVLGLPAPGLSFSLLLHLGTALATVVMLWQEIAWLLRGIFLPGSSRERTRAWSIVGLLAVASVPGAVAGLFFGDFLDTVFGSGGVAAAGLIITGFILRYSARARTGDTEPRARAEGDEQGERSRSVRRNRRGREGHGDAPLLGTVDLRRAIIVGLSQGVAVIPGISRSGTTITSGLLSGMDREDAARFSFLLALPAIFGGALLDFREALALGEPIFGAAGFFGALVAFLSGLFALSFVFRAARKGDLAKFGYYCWAAGVLSLLYLMFRQ